MEKDPELLKLPNYDPYLMAEGYRFDKALGMRAVNFIERYCTFTGTGGSYLLSDWQKCIVLNLFSWVSIETGRRRFRTLFLFVPRKNSKTDFCACLNLYCLYADGEFSGQIVCAASNKEQAENLFNAAKGMVLRNSTLKSMSNGQIFKSSIARLKTNSVFKVITATPNTKHGLNISCATVDELAQMPNGQLVDALFSSQGARKQPLRLMLTTAPYEGDNSVCNMYYDIAVRVRDNKGNKDEPGYDPTFLPVIYETLPTQNWRDESVWQACNPNWGKSVIPENLRADFREADGIPALEARFKQLNLCMKVSQAYKWLDITLFNDCFKDIKEDDLYKMKCFGAYDGSSVHDMSSFAMFYPEIKAVKVWQWIPAASALELKKVKGLPIKEWASKGHVKITDGSSQHYKFIKEELIEICTKHENIDTVVFDRAYAGEVMQGLQGIGVNCEEIIQGVITLSAPTKYFELLYCNKEINLLRNPVLKWQFSNAYVETDKNLNYSLHKKKSLEMVDGCMATVMSLAPYLRNGDGVSVYERR